MTYTIDLKLPSLNEYVSACNNNRYGGGKHKESVQNDIIWFLTPRVKINYPIYVKFIWHEANKKRDKDNVAFAKKYILDALQVAGILPNDNNKYITGFSDTFIYDGTNKVEVALCKAERT